jgi:hypothetical protein
MGIRASIGMAVVDNVGCGNTDRCAEQTIDPEYCADTLKPYRHFKRAVRQVSVVI